MISSRERETEAVFGINQTVEIEVRGTDSTQRYPSRVEDRNGTTIALSMPMRHTNLVRLPVGLPVILSTVEKDALYAIRGRVLSNQVQPLPLVVIAVESGLERLQRRRHVRVDTYLENARVTIIAGDDEERVSFATTILSLSAGGLLFRSETSLAKGADLLVSFRPDDGLDDEIKVYAKVARIEDERQKGKARSLGCYFTSIQAADEKRIVRYVFRTQIELRKRGLA